MMKRLLAVLTALMLLGGFAVAQDENAALPHMVKVTFPEGVTYTAPANAKDNFDPNPACFSEDDRSYHDDSLDVQIHTFHKYDTNITVAFVQIATPDQMRTEQARPWPQRGTVRPTVIAKHSKAVLAVNTDWFTYHNEGIIYRNGVCLRKNDIPSDDGLVIDYNGDFHIVRPMTTEAYDELEKTVQIRDAFAFGPALVIDGEVQEIVNRKVTYKQRIGVGQIAPLSYVIVAASGPEEKGQVGLSVPQLAELMHDLGAQTAYNMDGGQSSALAFHYIKLNANPKVMRAMGEILYFTTAIPDGK